jgi:hypothetical protein
MCNAIDFQKLSCSKILKVLGRWFGRNPFSKGFLPRRLLLSCNYLPGDLYQAYIIPHTIIRDFLNRIGTIRLIYPAPAPAPAPSINSMWLVTS